MVGRDCLLTALTHSAHDQCMDHGTSAKLARAALQSVHAPGAAVPCSNLRMACREARCWARPAAAVSWRRRWPVRRWRRRGTRGWALAALTELIALLVHPLRAVVGRSPPSQHQGAQAKCACSAGAVCRAGCTAKFSRSLNLECRGGGGGQGDGLQSSERCRAHAGADECWSPGAADHVCASIEHGLSRAIRREAQPAAENASRSVADGPGAGPGCHPQSAGAPCSPPLHAAAAPAPSGLPAPPGAAATARRRQRSACTGSWHSGASATCVTGAPWTSRSLTASGEARLLYHGLGDSSKGAPVALRCGQAP